MREIPKMFEAYNSEETEKYEKYETNWIKREICKGNPNKLQAKH